MTKRIRKSIKIDDFMKLWENIQENKWDEVLPDWDIETSHIFLRELAQRFRTSKQGGSFGQLWEPSVANVLWSIAGKNETPITLNTMGYRKKYASSYPIAWVRSGDLRDKISPLVKGMPIKRDRWGIEIGIPIKDRTYDEEPWKDVPPNPLAYVMLEFQRSYIGSSLLLSWPTIIKKTLGLIGT